MGNRKKEGVGLICAWCRRDLEATRTRGRFCGRLCRQAAFRLRRRRVTVEASSGAGEARRFVYADPPYPGLSSKYYRDEPTFAGEVDFPVLIASLLQELRDGACGIALSTSARSLATLLPLFPPEHRVCAWVKPHAAAVRTFGLHNVWEPLIVVGGRQLPPGVRDALWAHAARGGGELPGRKPLAFCAWLFDCLGMLPGDALVDLFPGSGVVSRAWGELSSGSAVSLAAGESSGPRFGSRWQQLDAVK